MSNLKDFVHNHNPSSNNDLKVPIPDQSGIAQSRYAGHVRHFSPRATAPSAIKLERSNGNVVSNVEESNYSDESAIPNDFKPGTELSPTKQYAVHTHGTGLPSQHQQLRIPHGHSVPLSQTRMLKSNTLYDAQLAEMKKRMRANMSMQDAPQFPIPALLQSNSYPTTSSGNPSPVEEGPDIMWPRSNEDIPVTSDDHTDDEFAVEQLSVDVQAEPPTPHGNLSPSPQRPQQTQYPFTRRRPFLEDPTHDGMVASLTPEPSNQVLLDYDEAQLRTIDFEDLKALPFDKDPKSETFVLPKSAEGDTLASKLELVAKLPEQEQKRFLTSLMIGEWEDAGDWFLERFGDVFKQLKELRRQMRAASLALENECEARCAAVEEKRKGTEAALAAMRERGEKVLQSTSSPSRD